jgi:hypothetical protein
MPQLMLPSLLVALVQPDFFVHYGLRARHKLHLQLLRHW